MIKITGAIVVFFFFNTLLFGQESNAIRKFPLHVLPVVDTRKDTLVIYLTGDGGWNSFNEHMARAFNKQGYPVIALNTNKHFWKASTPDVFIKDFELIAAYYLKVWHKSSLVIAGYSFGADIAAFVPKRLSAGLLQRTKLLILMSPSASTDFEVKLSDMLFSEGTGERYYKVLKELDQCPLPLICIFGSDEDSTIKQQLKKNAIIKVVDVPGSHEYDNSASVMAIIFNGIQH